MITGKFRNIACIIACGTLILSGTVLAAGGPKAEIQSTIDSILDILRDKALAVADKKEERRDKITVLIDDRFAFQEMSRRILARHWKNRTAEERKEFISIFSDTLVTSYVGKIERYTDEKITYDKETFKGNKKYGVVSTTVVTKDVNIPIDYKVMLRDRKWWVYDVVIEGVSFISTYRSQYNKVIKRESYAELIRKMKGKLDEMKAAL